jgi:SpoVK/Ycf46/Vps4 family AAA+-type ATPase
MFNSLVGESEARMRAALALAEALAPCTVWIDEIDKGLAGSGGSGANDSGVTKRVFGTLISWMQERKRPVFIVATANDVTNLPSEFLRRWDKIFAMDIPNRTERAEIFKIHLEKRKRSAVLATAEVIKATEGYTGAEIEKVVDEALYNAFDLERDLIAQDLLDAVEQVTPLIVTAREKVEEIRGWVSGRATLASLPETAEETGTTMKRRIAK